MKFRFKAFGLHLFGSCCVMALVWGALYLGWYRWPGWYLSGALGIGAIMAGVDLVLGPTLTFIVANPGKPRRELARDISMIVLVQLVALGYGSVTLWHGRPLYYTYSERFLQMVQAGDLDPKQVVLGQQLNPALAPHWYSLPRWIYAPLPKEKSTRDQIIAATVTGGDDVIQMPRYYQPWEAGLPEMRKNLRVLGKMTEFGLRDKQKGAQRMKQMGIPTDQPAVLPMMGRGKRLLAVIEPKTMRILEFVKFD
jgi:hypothetical protein